MLPISAIVGISTVGYLIDQMSRKNEFDENNKDTNIPVQNINGCEEQYPWNFIESFENTDSNSNNVNNNLPSVPSALTPVNINSPNNIEAINDSSPNYLINANKRPVEDFVHNNMVPFFRGTGTGQTMKSTGVAEGNINYDNYNTGTDNLTPNYTKLATFSGYDNTYLHKREVPEMFSPTERLINNTVPGMEPSAQRPDLDRYTTSILYKPDQKPFESIRVGPGIAIDSSLPNDGQGFNSGMTSDIKLNNVNAYRLNQLPGRVAGTKAQVGDLPTALPGSGASFASYQNSLTNDGKSNAIDSNGNIDTQKLINQGSLYGVPLKKPSLSTELTLERRPMVATHGGVIQAPMTYSNLVFPSGTNKRSTTNVSFGDSIEVR